MTIKITDFNPASYQTELPTQLYLYMYSISFICFVFIILYGGVCFITKFCFYILMFLYHSVDAVRGGEGCSLREFGKKVRDMLFEVLRNPKY